MLLNVQEQEDPKYKYTCISKWQKCTFKRAEGSEPSTNDLMCWEAIHMQLFRNYNS